MALPPGTQLAEYRILSLIGVGGMGEVYRAHDTKLDRDVALKVLPAAFARDPERLARFEREARVLASLNHPNIGAIYGMGQDKGIHFLVLELVLGDTLRERLAKTGPVPADEVLHIGEQIAEALEVAHEKPIVHRDLKPANIKITPEGKVKVLDFGLAKAFGAAAEVDPHDLPTGSIHGTLAGTVLGTPAYMSPEQAGGKTVDKRADIWSLGCVLYELLTGKQAFTGDTVTEIIASVLKSEPDWSALPADTSPNVRVLLKRCLRKDLPGRFRDPTDVRITIEEARSALASTAVPARSRWAWRQALPWALLAILAVAMGVLGPRAFRNASPARQSPVRFSLAPPPDLQLADVGPRIALSPDGSRLALVVRKGNTRQLYIRSLNQSEAVPLPGTELANNPFFSPDGKWVAFTANRELKKVSVEGGSPQVLCQADFGGGSWGPDDTIIYTPSYSTGLWRVPASGGVPEKLTEPDQSRGELGHWWPQLLPDGETVLFTSYSTPLERSRITTYSLKTRQQKVLVEGAIFGRYLNSGHIVYVRSESLLAAPFDWKRLQVGGPGTQVLDDVAVEFAAGLADASFSADGTLAYVRASSLSGGRRLVRVDRKGNVQPITEAQRNYSGPTFSPDGRRIAVAISESGKPSDIWTFDLERGTFTRVTFGSATEFNPLWTRDGKRLIFSSEQPQFDLHWKAADGTGAEDVLLTNPHDKAETTLSPDGKFLVYVETNPKTASDLWLLPLEGARKPRLWLQTPFEETAPALSPDGRWLAYVSDVSRRSEVYVQAFPGPGERVQVSVEGGQEPVWAPDGRELFYRVGDKLMAVPVTTGERFTTGKPVALFQGDFALFRNQRQYDVRPDSKSFVMVQRDPQARPVEVQVVLNWFEELKRRVPTR